jgi:hypothetical protein
MTDERESLRDDIAFLRDLARDDGSDLAREASNMIVIGLVFGAVTFTYWLVFSGYVALPPTVVSWLWAAGVALMILVHMLLNRGVSRATGAASRAVAAAWGGIGVSLLAPCLGLMLGGARIGNAHLVLWIFPTILFTLYGAAWGVAWVVKRRQWLFNVAFACAMTAFVEGGLVSSPHQWLVLSAGLLLLVALPGAVILRQSRARAG